MVFEIAGFLTGVAAIGIAFLLMYRRDSTTVVAGIYGHTTGKPRA